MSSIEPETKYNRSKIKKIGVKKGATLCFIPLMLVPYPTKILSTKIFSTKDIFIQHGTDIAD
ncbi:hypothetical protein GCM10007877_18410 [Marinibactrum halimedae]|uniref:Uncharacterized protein n=1 Tax=Marinibactrum halimedae TaxID=1444977 RepID=A0AA37T8T6_9GAMM|nr:hypothetical protein GCM10007877_18410 [Marinibactrum halimedae]